MTWTVGLSYDSIDNLERDLTKLSPKLGLQWNLTDWAGLRLAYLQSLKGALVVNQTIQTTQVAGFNQFFDDFNGTETERYGISLDTILGRTIYGGVEYSQRNLKVPGFSTSEGSLISNRSEDLARAYLYWTPHQYWAVSAEAGYERFHRESTDRSVIEDGEPTTVETITVPIAVRYFHPSGFFSTLGGTLVEQKVALAPSSTFARDKDTFFVIDTTIGYRLPKRRGIISLEAKNLLNEKFLFQDQNIQTAGEAVNPLFIPDRALFFRATFAFN